MFESYVWSEFTDLQNGIRGGAAVLTDVKGSIGDCSLENILASPVKHYKRGYI